MRSLSRAPCRALRELCLAELRVELRREPLVELRREPLVELRAELLAELLAEPLVELYAESWQSFVQSFEGAS